MKEGIRAAGGTPMEFNTIAISDGITMGTEGMKTSLVSREVIADSIELMARGHMFDGMVALVACDKTIPGGAHGAAAPQRSRRRSLRRLDSARAGTRATTSPFRTSSKPWAPMPPEECRDSELLEIENHACPGAGACGGQFTANTMATVMELIGLSPMGTAAVPQVDPRKEDVAPRCGEVIMNCVREEHPRPRDIATRKAFENAIAGVAATGGSTNAVLHLLAMAREAGVALEIEDFQTHQRAHALFVDLKPGGQYVAVDVDKAGGIGVIAKRLVEGKYVDRVGAHLHWPTRSAKRPRRPSKRRARR